ncbi:MAG: HK97-gp10 family putative phage morphogenesis protein [Bauldia sp.]
MGWLLMPMRVTYQIEGLRQLDEALGELKKSTARRVLHKVLKRAGEPIAEAARRLAPDDPATDPPTDLKSSIEISSRIRNTVGNAAYSAVMRAAGSRAEAVSASRAARRGGGDGGSFAEAFVGPRKGRNSKVGALQEFGTVKHPPHPFMRPAWASQKGAALEIIRRDLATEIAAAAKRAAARALKKAGR